MNGTLHQRKNTVSNSDPEAGITPNDDHNHHHNPILDNEGINVNSIINDAIDKNIFKN